MDCLSNSGSLNKFWENQNVKCNDPYTYTFSSPSKYTFQLQADKVLRVLERAGEVCGSTGSFFHWL